jgi:20S proteasome subunit alpha 2
MSERYNFSLTTFSPSGKLLQIEHALTAVAAGAPSVGIKAVNGVIIAAEKKFKSSLTDPQSSFRVEQISRFCGVVYSGLTPDFRVLVKKAQKEALEYKLQYGEEIPPTQLAQRISLIMQEFTQSGGVRPFGVSLLVAGWDVDAKRPYLYQCDPSVGFSATRILMP